MNRHMRVISILVIILCLVSGITPCSQAEAQCLAYEWVEGEEYFPRELPWTYHYTYRYPMLLGEGMLQEAINDYFRNALNEMTMLVIPMFAADPIMIGEGSNEISQNYEVTCNNGTFFSVLMTQAQTVEGRERISLESAVFDASGEYLGETLTLRGLVRVGPSSQALSEAVLQDVWEDIDLQMRDKSSGWKSSLTSDILKAEFYPEVQFYADDLGNAVFYLQPGRLRQDDRVVTYTYTPQMLEELLAK